MKLNVKDEKYGVCVVAVDGNIMQEFVTVFRMRLDDLLASGKFRIVLDLTEVTYMSSMCLAIIIDIKNKTSAREGDAKIACPTKLVANLLEITNLNRRLAIFDTVEQAIEAFNPERF